MILRKVRVSADLSHTDTTRWAGGVITCTAAKPSAD